MRRNVLVDARLESFVGAAGWNACFDTWRLRVPDVGLERAGLDQVHVDAERPELVAPRLREPLERELRGCVGSERGKGGAARAGRHHHDRPALLGAHRRKDRACQQPRREEVRLEHVAQLVLADLFEETAERDPCVVDEGVDSALLG
jgi:hypothetical protein